VNDARARKNRRLVRHSRRVVALCREIGDIATATDRDHALDGIRILEEQCLVDATFLRNLVEHVADARVTNGESSRWAD
jgi:hypothetical protein